MTQRTFSRILVLFLLLTGTVHAMTIREKQFTCPIDGTAFEYMIALSGSQFGMRLDLQPLGPTPAPWSLPSCPECRFPLFEEEFSDEEIERYRELVESEAFREVTENKSSYFTLALVKEHDGEAAGEIGYAYLRASWQLEEEREKYEKCLALALEQYREDFESEEHEERVDAWWTSGILVAELERQLGNFEAALNQVERLRKEEIDQIGRLAESEVSEPRAIE